MSVKCNIWHDNGTGRDHNDSPQIGFSSIANLMLSQAPISHTKGGKLSTYEVCQDIQGVWDEVSYRCVTHHEKLSCQLTHDTGTQACDSAWKTSACRLSSIDRFKL